MASKSDTIIHYGAVKLRVLGSGELRMTFYSPEEVRSKLLTPLTMIETTDKMINKLANFKGETAQLEIKTTGFEEWFSIGRIIIYTKPVEGSYPQ